MLLQYEDLEWKNNNFSDRSMKKLKFMLIMNTDDVWQKGLRFGDNYTSL